MTVESDIIARIEARLSDPFERAKSLAEDIMALGAKYVHFQMADGHGWLIRGPDAPPVEAFDRLRGVKSAER